VVGRNRKGRVEIEGEREGGVSRYMYRLKVEVEELWTRILSGGKKKERVDIDR
jgi:hypothetical protein